MKVCAATSHRSQFTSHHDVIGGMTRLQLLPNDPTTLSPRVDTETTPSLSQA